MKRAVFNQKGGVGKSSITCNLAAISASMGQRTLVVDMDVQGNSSMYLGHDIHRPSSACRYANLAELLKSTTRRGGYRKLNALDHILETEFDNLHLIAASTELAGLETALGEQFETTRVRHIFDGLETLYDRIYFDTPPALNFFSELALNLAERVLIPFDCDLFAQQALYNVVDTMRQLKASSNPQLAIEGVVINQFSAQSKLPAELVSELQQSGIPVLDAYLSNSVRMRASHIAQQPLIYFDRGHQLSQQFIRLYELIEAVTCSELRKTAAIEKVDLVAEMVRELTAEPY